MKKLFFALLLLLSCTVHAQLADPTDIPRKQIGMNWKFDEDTVVFNRIHVGDGKFGIDSLGRIIYYNNSAPTAGKMLYANGTYYTTLSIGTAGQLLRVNTGATAPEWFNPAYGSGTVTSVSATDNTTFDFTVTNPTTTPDITATLKDRDWGDATLSSSGTVLTVDNDAIALGTKTTGNYAAGDAEAGNATGVACTGCIDIATEVSGLGSGIATFLGTASSSNLRSALTDENGTGAALFSGATSPSFAGTTAMASGSFTGIVTTYNNITTANNGLLSSVGTPVHLTGQTASIAATSCYTTTADGYYAIYWNAAITTPATTGAATSTLGHFQIQYTNVADNVVKTTPTQNNVTASAANATTGTGSGIGGVITVYAKSGTNIKYIMGYSSNTAAQMQYSLDITVVKL